MSNFCPRILPKCMPNTYWPFSKTCPSSSFNSNQVTLSDQFFPIERLASSYSASTLKGPTTILHLLSTFSGDLLSFQVKFPFWTSFGHPWNFIGPSGPQELSLVVRIDWPFLFSKLLLNPTSRYHFAIKLFKLIISFICSFVLSFL